MSEHGSAAAPPSRSAVVTWRAVLLGLLLIPANVYWVQFTECVSGVAMPTMASLFFTAVLTLLGLVMLNAVVRAMKPAWALAPGELLVTYAMVSVASAVAGHDQVEVLVNQLAAPYRFATPENHWAALFHASLPRGLNVAEPAALQGFWEGHSSAWTPEALRAFAPALAGWLGFALALYGAMLCINLIFRPRWTEAERLGYPLIQLPLELAERPRQVFRGGAFWAGFGLAGAIDLINGLHALYPVVPRLQVTAVDLRPMLSSSWSNALDYMPVAGYPWAVGLGYLLPTDYLLSHWLFFWLWKLERVWGAFYARGSRFPYVSEQSCGAYLGMALFTVTIARFHLRRVAAQAVRHEVDEPTGVPRVAVWGLAVCSLAMLEFWHRAGMGWGVAALFLAFYGGVCLGLTRMRAEMGVPAHDLLGMGPDRMLVGLCGTSALGPRNLTAFAHFHWLNRAHRSNPMPHQVEGLQLGARHGSGGGRLALCLLAASLWGFAVGFLCMMHLGFRHGMANVPTDASYFGTEPWHRLAGQLSRPVRPESGVAGGVLAGAGFTLVLLRLRTRFVGWPLHPIGYAVTSGYMGAILWLPMLVAWVIKANVLRYGGLRLYRRWMPFFLGLLCGEFVVGGGWSLIGTLTGWPTYRFWAY